MKTIIYDIETLKNVFTLNAKDLHANRVVTFEISERRNDFDALRKWLRFLKEKDYRMVSFNGFGYDYPLLHHLHNNGVRFENWKDLCELAYRKSKAIIRSNDRFAHTIWDNEHIVKQVDLFKLHHFDNRAKTTSLKRLQFNMRLKNIVEFSMDFDKPLPVEEIPYLVSYNKHDVTSTEDFYNASQRQIDFRTSLIDKFGWQVMNHNDTKIGENSVVSTLVELVGQDKIYVWEEDPMTGERKRKPRQTHRDIMPLKNIIFNHINFKSPEFNEVLERLRTLNVHIINGKFQWNERPDFRRGLQAIKQLKGQIKQLGKDKEAIAPLKEKLKKFEKAFADHKINCKVDGFRFDFGKGGLHGARKWSGYKSSYIGKSDRIKISIMNEIDSCFPGCTMLLSKYKGEDLTFAEQYIKYLTEKRTA